MTLYNNIIIIIPLDCVRPMNEIDDDDDDDDNKAHCYCGNCAGRQAPRTWDAAKAYPKAFCHDKPNKDTPQECSAEDIFCCGTGPFDVLLCRTGLLAQKRPTHPNKTRFEDEERLVL